METQNIIEEISKSHESRVERNVITEHHEIDVTDFFIGQNNKISLWIIKKSLVGNTKNRLHIDDINIYGHFDTDNIKMIYAKKSHVSIILDGGMITIWNRDKNGHLIDDEEVSL